MAAIHCCTAPNSTGRYAESGKFFKQEKMTAPKAAFFAGERQSFYGVSITNRVRGIVTVFPLNAHIVIRIAQPRETSKMGSNPVEVAPYVIGKVCISYNS
jgi:hypothetical protein